MTAFPNNFKNYYQLLTTFYFASLIGLILIMAAFYYITPNSYINFNSPEKYILTGFTVIILSFIASYFIQQNMLKRAVMQGTVKEKLKIYLLLIIIKTAILIIVGLLNLSFFLMAHNKVFLIFAAYSILMLLMLLFMKPNPDKMIEDLLMTIHEKEFITNPEREFD